MGAQNPFHLLYSILQITKPEQLLATKGLKIRKKKHYYTSRTSRQIQRENTVGSWVAPGSLLLSTSEDIDDT